MVFEQSGRILAQTELLFFIARTVLDFDITLNLSMPLPLEVGFTLELAKGTKPMALFAPVVQLAEELEHPASLDVSSAKLRL